MSECGWVKIDRSLVRHPRFSDAEWLAVWLFILLNVTHKIYRTVFDGKVIELQPGQFITGRHAISEATGVHESKVKRILALMKSDQQIDQQAGVKGSIITVLNWARYQGGDQQTDQLLTSDRPATDQPLTTKQEQKNIRIEEEERSVELPPGFPKTEKDAAASAASVGCSEEFAKAEWNYAAGLGGRVGNARIYNWPQYLKSRFIKEQGREAERKARNFNPRTTTIKPDHSKGF